MVFRIIFYEGGQTNYDDVPREIKKQIEKEWGNGQPARNQKGWRWENPKNGETIRYGVDSDGKPYVKWTDANGQPLDVNGNRIPGSKPSEIPEAHIPAEKFQYKPPAQ